MRPKSAAPRRRYDDRSHFCLVLLLVSASLLTRSKSVPVTEDQVKRHREQRRQRDEWRADVERLTDITGRLRTEYAKHKGDFAVGRYEELKVYE
jgi:hypothetical protein